MNITKLSLVWASLLHDLGKVILRSGKQEAGHNHSQAGSKALMEIIPEGLMRQSVTECVRYHHAREIRHSDLPSDHLAWLVCEADNIASGADRRKKPSEGDEDQLFDPRKSLESVFNIITTPRSDQDLFLSYPVTYGYQDEHQLVMPHYSGPDASQRITAERYHYSAIWHDLKRDLASIDWQDPSYIHSLYSILDGYLSFVPASTDTTEVADQSLFDHLSLTAAVAACLYDWCEEQQETDYRTLFEQRTSEIRRKPVFLLAHADLSGIQSFIYTIRSKGALKSLRGRSFYLELLLEQTADEIIAALELTRANLLYNGGGGFFLLLPHTKKAISTLQKAYRQFNHWLLTQFGNQLYLGLSYSPACAYQFMWSDNDQTMPIRDVYQTISHEISVQKLRRHADGHLEEIFTPSQPEIGTRECSICGVSQHLLSDNQIDETVLDDLTFDETICSTCDHLIRLGGFLALDYSVEPDSQRVFVVNRTKPSFGLALPLPSFDGSHWLSVRTQHDVRRLLQSEPSNIARIYSKNYRASGLHVSTRLWIGDYNHCDNQEKGAVAFQNFVGLPHGSGVARLAVLRADVDDLGQLFVKGISGGKPNRLMYDTLGRSVALSHSLTRFFRSHINRIAEKGRYNLVIVYSGGDDLFAVGWWQDIIDFALDLREAFRSFTGDKLSLSAGIGFFHHSFPIARMAEITGQLEKQAKSGQKDQIALFGLESRNDSILCRHIYTWADFKDQVLVMRDFLIQHLDLDQETSSQAMTGRSFLYKLLGLLNMPESDQRLSLARFAYLIARRDPGDNASQKEIDHYQQLRNTLYRWASKKDSRNQLLTATMLCIYSIRRKGDKSHEL